MYTTKKFIKQFGIILPLLMLFSACGELSYKRGASNQDLENARRMCKSSEDEQSVEACLKNNGWAVQKLDDLDLFAIPSVNPDNRAIPTSKPSTYTSSSAVNSASDPSAAATTTAAKPIEHSPDEIFSIGSWWKIGGSDSQLKSDINQCVSSLGEAHRPSVAEQKYTYAMVVCLHNKGWKALKNVK
jgi:hypothetical protein